MKHARRDTLDSCSAACAFILASKIPFICAPLCISLGFIHLRVKAISNRLLHTPTLPGFPQAALISQQDLFQLLSLLLLMIPARGLPLEDLLPFHCSTSAMGKRGWERQRNPSACTKSHLSTNSQCSPSAKTSEVVAVIHHAAIFPIFPQYLLLHIISGKQQKLG